MGSSQSDFAVASQPISSLDNIPLTISVVIPVYGCRSTILELCERLGQTLIPRVPAFEVILVDDQSPDNAWETIEEIVSGSSYVRGVRLSRNFGQHAAIAAGISLSRGQWIAIMDCDLEDPPEVLAELFRIAVSGYDVVIGRRVARAQGLARGLLSKAYFSLINSLSDVSIDGTYGALSIFSQKVRADYLKIGDGDRHHVMILKWLGFRTAIFDYKQQQRDGRVSSYTFSSLIRSAVSGVMFQTTVLLRWVIYFGFAVAGLGFIAALWLVYQYTTMKIQPGWTSLAVLILLIGGMIILSIGIVGLYVGRIFEKARSRPLFVVDEVIDHAGFRKKCS